MSNYSKLIPLILLQDFCYQFQDTIQDLALNGIKEVVVLNTAGELSKASVQEICTKRGVKCNYLEHEFVNYSHARNVLSDYAHGLFRAKQVAFLIHDPGDMLEITDHEEAKSVINSVFKFKHSYGINQKWTSVKLDGTSDITIWRLVKMFPSSIKHTYQGYGHEYISLNQTSYSRTFRTDCIIQYQKRYNEDSQFKSSLQIRSDTMFRLLQQQLSEIESKYKSIKNKNQRYELKTRDDLYPRTTFYLAQECMMQLEKYDKTSPEYSELCKKAYMLYKRRSMITGHFIEEQFEATCRCARLLLYCHEQLTLPELDTQIRYWLDCALSLQERAEVYIMYINYLLYGKPEVKYIGNNSEEKRSKDIELAHEQLNKLITLEYPTNACLFIDEKAYTNDRKELYLKVFPPKFEKPSECTVCYDSTELQLLLPCSHWLCSKCCTKLESKCFFCRQPVNVL
jgi:hypothetical protein